MPNSQMIAEIKTTIEGTHRAFENFRNAHDSRYDEIAGAVDGVVDRIERIEAKAGSIGRTAGTPESREHLKLFTDWIRKPGDSSRKQVLGDFEAKAVNITTASDGGFAVPEEIARDIERLELEFSPVRRLVRVVRVGTGDYKHLVNVRGATSGWVGESDSRNETSTPGLREVAPTFGEIYSYPQTTEWALDDVFFDVGAWLAEEVAQQFAQAEGSAVISGDGTNKPTGMLNTTPVTTDDFASPLRAAAAYEFVASATASSPAVAEIVPDSLIDLMFTLNSAYRANATWVMNSATAGTVRKLKDSQGRYLWTDGLAAGQPSTLLGHPVALW